MKKLLLLLTLLLSSHIAYSAHSPLNQSIIEIRDIITSPDLKRFIPPHEAILNIQWIRNGYLISTTHYQLFVEVIYRPGRKSDTAETQPFQLKFNEPQSK